MAKKKPRELDELDDAVVADVDETPGAGNEPEKMVRKRKCKGYCIRVVDPSIGDGSFDVGDALGDLFIPADMSPIVVNDGIWRGKLRVDPY